MSKCTCGFDLRHDVDHADFCERKSKQVVNTYSEYRVAIDGVLIPRNQVFTKPDVQREKLALLDEVRNKYSDLVGDYGGNLDELDEVLTELKQRIQSEVE